MRTGIDAQFMLGRESTYGTSVTPDVTLPIVSESVAAEIERIESAAIHTGRTVLKSEQWAPGRSMVAGDTAFELYDTGMVELFEAMFGGLASAAGTHTLTPGELGHYTLQFGRPDRGGFVRPFTYDGCKVSSWEIRASEGEAVTLGVDWIGRRESLAEALETPAIPAGIRPFWFTDVTLDLDGAETCASQLTISGDNNLVADKFCLGDQYPDEAVPAGLRTYSGAVQATFESMALLNHYRNSTEIPIVFSAAAGGASLTITMNVRLDGETPAIAGREELTLSLPFTCMANGTEDSSAITAVYVAA